MPFKDTEQKRAYHRDYMRRRRAGVKPSPGTKVYVCERYPFYEIGKIKFKHGRFVTDRPEDQALIEGSDWYGVYIHLAE